MGHTVKSLGATDLLCVVGTTTHYTCIKMFNVDTRIRYIIM